MTRRIAPLLLALVALLSLAGCGEGERLVEGAVAEGHEAPFYAVPDPLPDAAPGTVIRSEPMPNAPAGAVAWRVLYHSRDLRGADVAVSGVVVAPAAPAPPGGRTVVSWAHPTTGAAPRCAPSVGVDPFWLIEGLPDLLRAGYVVAATDYPGMGAPGPNAYLIGETAGHSVLDAARAARALPTGANDRLLLWGHSQGGQAVLFAAQSAPAYAPETSLRGVAAAAPATDLGGLLTADIGDVSGVTIGAYAFDAFATIYSDVPGATLDTVLTPAGAAATPGMAQLCLIGQNGELHRIADPLIGRYLAKDPTTTEPWAGFLRANTPGAVPIRVPLFLAQGGADTLVRPALTWAYADRACRSGTPVTRLPLPGAGHGQVAFGAIGSLIPWFGGVDSGALRVPPC